MNFVEPESAEQFGELEDAGNYGETGDLGLENDAVDMDYSLDDYYEEDAFADGIKLFYYRIYKLN